MADPRRAHDFHRNIYPYLRGEKPRKAQEPERADRGHGRLRSTEDRSAESAYDWDFAERDFSRDYNRDYAHLDFDPDRTRLQQRYFEEGGFRRPEGVSGRGVVRRPGPHSGKGPKGWSRSDERIREEVSDRLQKDPEIDASEILVQVKGGVVTLEGSVDERRTRRWVEELVENCRGVIDVRNHLTVRQSL